MLNRQPGNPQVVGQRTAYSVKLTVTSTDPVRFPTKAFVFQAEEPANPDTRGWFTAVASPAQLLEYPEDVPAYESGAMQQPYYRLDEVELVGRNPGQIEELTNQIVEELDLLARNLEALERFEEATLILPPYRSSVIFLWEGVPALGPYIIDSTAGDNPIVRAYMEFRNRMTPAIIDAILDSSDEQVLIVDADTWELSVPEQVLPLNPGLYDWVVKTVDALEEVHTVQRGTIEVLIR